MANWEYKVLSGGKMGLGSMAMLEQFLNELGQQQWEVVSWQTDPETPLKFSGLARRPILRDITPAEMPAAMDKEAIAAAKEEADREREAWVETLAREREFYAKSIEDEGSQEDDDDDEDRDLVGDLFAAVRPLMKRNNRGPGASGSVVYLAKKLDQSEEDLIGALSEAGLKLGDDEKDSEPLENGGDMFWLNVNSRGEVWINSVPKSRYRPPQPKKQDREAKPSEPRQQEKSGAEPKEPPAPSELPEGAALLARLRPMMRRNRGNRGLSGSLPFLSRALRQSEEALAAALAGLGLTLPDDPKAEAAPVEIEGLEYWLNKNEKGQVWINAREKSAVDAKSAEATEREAAADGSVPPILSDGSADASSAPFAPAVVNSETVLELAPEHLAKVGRSTTAVSSVSDLAGALGISEASLIDALIGAGLAVPMDAGEKPVFVEEHGYRFWLSRDDDGPLSLNAKQSRRPRSRKRD
jgi:hypothetical protein